MAARDNQGYLIAIIVLSLLCIALLLGTVFGWSKASENYDARIASEANFKSVLKSEQTLSQAYETKSFILERMIGSGGGSVIEIQPQLDALTRLTRGVDAGDKSKVDAVVASLIEIKAIYDTDMKYNSSSGAANDLEPTYKNLVANLNSVLAKKQNE